MLACCCTTVEDYRFHDRNMAGPPHGDSVPPSPYINSNADDSNKVNQDVRSSPKNSVAATSAKSCKGYLYYSSILRADSRNPLCVGITQSLPAPVRIVGQSEIQATGEGRNITDFRYSCLGYSVYNVQKDQSSDGQKTQTELPHCMGLALLVEHDPAHIHNKEDSNGLPQRHSPKPSNSSGDEFLPRFTRNARLVADGVAKNVGRVGNRIRQCFDDILYPYRRPPK